jgi:serine/threonine-protein kinase
MRPPDPLLGQSFGKCTLLSLIGKGGMGSVYLAEHLFLKRRVAIKVLEREFCNDPEELARFEREAIAAAKLDHENIVTIHDVDEEDGRLFIVMEWVEGEDLDDYLRRKGPLPVRRAAEIVHEVARALGHAHAAGVVHRDIKPGNILIGKKGQVKITDFGLALDAGKRDSSPDGFVLGTPFYISPEQVQGLPADGRSDLYSLGITFYQMLTGHRPFGGRSPDSVVKKHLEERRPSPRLRRPGLARSIEAIVQRLIARRPEHRYPSVKPLRRDLELFLARKPFLRIREPR